MIIGLIPMAHFIRSGKNRYFDIKLIYYSGDFDPEGLQMSVYMMVSGQTQIVAL